MFVLTYIVFHIAALSSHIQYQTPSFIMEESEASNSSSAPKSKKPKLNFSHVHQEFEKIKIFNVRKDKEVDGSKCKECGQTFLMRSATNLKAHLERKHPELHRVVESKSVGVV